MLTQQESPPAAHRGRGATQWLRRHVRAAEYIGAILLLMVLTLIFFNPLFRGFTFSDVGAQQTATYPWSAYPTNLPGTFPQTDQADTYYPWEIMTRAALREGTIPLWSPYSFAGQPFIANGQSGVFYPPKIILLLLVSADWVHDLLCATSVFVGGIAMFSLMKAYGCGFAGALLAAVAWMLNPYLLAWLQLEITAPISLLLPIGILCVYQAHRRSSWRYAIGAGAAIGAMFLGCSIVYATLISIACGLYALALWLIAAPAHVRGRAWTMLCRGLLRVAIVAVVAVGIAAIQIVPVLALSRESGRALIPYGTFRASNTVQVATLLNAFRHPPLPVTASEIVLSMSFVGLATAFFALIGLFRRGPGAAFARGLGLAYTLLAVGTPMTWLFYHLIPGFGSLWLGRTLFFWSFTLAILGGFGLDAILAWARAPRGIGSRTTRWLRAHTRPLRCGAYVVAVLAIGYTGGQLTVYGRQINPPFELRQTQNLFPETPLIGAIKADQRLHTGQESQRLISVRRMPQPTQWYPPTLYASQPMVFGFESAGGYDSLLPDRTVALWRVVEGYPPEQAIGTKLQSAYITGFYLPQTRFDLLARVGVTTIVTAPQIDRDPQWTAQRLAPVSLRRVYRGDDGELYDIVGAEPRAYLVHGAEYTANPLESLRRFSDPAFDYRTRVLFEGPPREAATDPPSPATTGNDAVTVSYHGVNDLSIDVSTAHAGWVVLNDMWAPGWHASVNGSPQAVLRANYAFRAIAVPAGTTHIEMSYRPADFLIGAATTGGTTGAVGVALVADGVRRRRKRPAQLLDAPPAPAYPGAGRIAGN